MRPAFSLSALRAGLAATARRARSPLLIALLLCALAATLYFAARWISAAAANRQIEALEAGRDVAVAPTAPDELVLARVLFLASRGEIDAAQPLVDALERRGSRFGAQARLALGDARLRRAFALLEASKLEEAGPFVNLARADYRAALTREPELWDARFNLDVASRLVRDFPAFEETRGDEAPKKERLWSDAPGRPKGLP
ncbi:hypothetical protein [Methylocella sp.]|uniref:hypothetical protein n=1 Tax=Methylocella sp. TaxID=1978226 RepID=UPI0035B377BF